MEKCSSPYNWIFDGHKTLLDERSWLGYKSRMLTKPLYFAPMLFIPLLLIGCNQDEHGHAELKTGKELFEHHCAPCHQQDGKGMFLKGFPAIKNTQLDAWQISHKIRGEEAEGRKMPSFAQMSEAEALLISNYIKNLK
jgi:mono/diheme cytochrome c family protein